MGGGGYRVYGACFFGVPFYLFLPDFKFFLIVNETLSQVVGFDGQIVRNIVYVILHNHQSIVSSNSQVLSAECTSLQKSQYDVIILIVFLKYFILKLQ